MKRKIILASTSPRRRELLAKTGLSFEVASSNYEEDMTLALPVAELVKHLSLGKAQSLIKGFENAIIIAADTVVALNDKILGKPYTSEMAIEMLRMLSGKPHSVFTGISIVDSGNGNIIQRVVESRIFFKDISDKNIQEYVATGDPLDKAGAYGIQGKAGDFIEKIDGSYDNIVGLPVDTLIEMLKEFDI